MKPDKIYILSALHHLLGLDTEIDPYDVTLCYVKPAERKKRPNLKALTKKEAKEWGKEVIKQLTNVSDIKQDSFIILAGQSYLDPIRESLTNIKEPLKGLRQGKRVRDLINKLKQ